MTWLTTLHAKLRWLERIEGYDSDAIRQQIATDRGLQVNEVRDVSVVGVILEMTGRTAEDLENEILTPGRRAAIAAGARHIRVGNDLLLAVKNGVVATVFRSGGRAKRGKAIVDRNRKARRVKRKAKRHATRGRQEGLSL